MVREGVCSESMMWEMSGREEFDCLLSLLTARAVEGLDPED